MTTKELNSKLQIVNVKDFTFATPKGNVNIHGFAFFIDGLGFLKFKTDIAPLPYTPLGGRKALQAIINAGGFLDYSGFEFVNAI